MPNIRPISDLRNSANEISDFCKQTREPVFITRNGTGDMVVQSMAEYERQQALIQALCRGSRNCRRRGRRRLSAGRRRAAGAGAWTFIRSRSIRQPSATCSRSLIISTRFPRRPRCGIMTCWSNRSAACPICPSAAQDRATRRWPPRGIAICL